MIDKSVYDSESVTEEQGMQNEPLVNKFIVHSKLPIDLIRWMAIMSILVSPIACSAN